MERKVGYYKVVSNDVNYSFVISWFFGFLGYIYRDYKGIVFLKWNKIERDNNLFIYFCF